MQTKLKILFRFIVLPIPFAHNTAAKGQNNHSHIILISFNLVNFHCDISYSCKSIGHPFKHTITYLLQLIQNVKMSILPIISTKSIVPNVILILLHYDL